MQPVLGRPPTITLPQIRRTFDRTVLTIPVAYALSMQREEVKQEILALLSRKRQ